jgi:4-hydroxybenzoate polyprenyltransferase
MTLRRKIIGMAKASHFGPTVLVVSISFILSFTQLSAIKSFGIAVAILAGQLVVGWTNDLLDHPLDAAAGRTKKPLVNEAVSRKQLKVGISIALMLAILLSFLGPLGVRGGLLHMLGLASATIYNFWAKSTWYSPLPYAISFGALPFAIYSVAGKLPPFWLYVDFALISIAFHFLNVLKDLEWDRIQKIRGLPQRLEKKMGVAVALFLVSISVLIAVHR